MYNLSLDTDSSQLLAKRSDLHFTFVTASGLLSSAAASLYSFSDKSKAWACDLKDEDPIARGGFAGSSSLFLTKTTLNPSRQYVLVFNATAPRETYIMLAHGSS